MDGIDTHIMHDGTLLLVEPERPGLDRRAFKSVGEGYEWAHYADVVAHDCRARFYGYAPKDLPASMLSA